MSDLDGFERYLSTLIRPPRGHRRISVSSKQITFSKELVNRTGQWADSVDINCFLSASSGKSISGSSSHGI